VAALLYLVSFIVALNNNLTIARPIFRMPGDIPLLPDIMWDPNAFASDPFPAFIGILLTIRLPSIAILSGFFARPIDSCDGAYNIYLPAG